MKKTFITSVLLLMATFSFAQFAETKMQVDSVAAPALVIETDMSKSDTKDAIEKYFESLHVDKEKGKGFIFKKSMPYMLFKRASADFMQGAALDFYFTVETKKQKGPDVTVVTIAVSQGYNNFANSQTETWKNLNRFGEYLRSNILEQFRVTAKVSDLNKDLKKAKSKLEDIEKDKADAEKNIAEKTKQLTTLQAQLEGLKAATKQ